MKIKDIIVADWSHDGACRMWEDNKGTYPEFNKKLYSSNELREDTFVEPINHVNSPNGTWQLRVATTLQRYTGIRMPSHRYMPTNIEER